MDTATNGVFASDVRDWEDPAGRRLSDRVWSNRQKLEQRLDAMIADGIARGATVDEIADGLISYVRPQFARWGSGSARHAAIRLASNELRRAHALAVQQTAMLDPAGAYLRYHTAPSHVEADTCDDRANRDSGYGRGVYPARDCPLPPRHVGCVCHVSSVSIPAQDMLAYAEQLRIEYGLNDPTDLAPADLAVFRAATQPIRSQVTLLFRAWFEQTGLVTPELLGEASDTVADWVRRVAAQKARI